MVAERNPFIVRQLARGEHFANREHEVTRMISALRDPGAGIMVYGHRRLGKSSALERAAEEVREGGGHAVVASLATATDAADAARRVLEAVQRQVGRSGREIVESIVGRLQATMEIQPSAIPGEMPAVRIIFGQPDKSPSIQLLPDILTGIDAEMRRRGRVLGLGLDEFQRIHAWGGEDAEWALREAIQRHEALGYVLAGSQRGLIEAMVTGRGRAFWKMFDILDFGAIDDGVLANWICSQARRTGIRLERQASERIIELARPRTRDVVQLARETWSRAAGGGATVAAVVDEAFEAVVDAQGAVYQKLWMGISATQQRVLQVVAVDPSIPLTARETLDRYRLGPKSTAHKAAEALVKAEHLVNIPGAGYRFDDPFFERWIQHNVLDDIGQPVPPLRARGVG